jgi:hypothetical protein
VFSALLDFFSSLLPRRFHASMPPFYADSRDEVLPRRYSTRFVCFDVIFSHRQDICEAAKMPPLLSAALIFLLFFVCSHRRPFSTSFTPAAPAQAAACH